MGQSQDKLRSVWATLSMRATASCHASLFDSTLVFICLARWGGLQASTGSHYREADSVTSKAPSPGFAVSGDEPSGRRQHGSYASRAMRGGHSSTSSDQRCLVHRRRQACYEELWRRPTANVFAATLVQRRKCVAASIKGICKQRFSACGRLCRAVYSSRPWSAITSTMRGRSPTS